MKKVFIILTIACLVCSCSQPPRLATYQKQEIECLGVEGPEQAAIRPMP